MIIDLKNLDLHEEHELLVSAILPRPIAFVSSIGVDGVYNLAPFSFFGVACLKPALVSLSMNRKRDGQKKDTLKNIECAKDFVINVVDEALAEKMNQAAAEYPSDIDEFKEVGLTPLKADLVKSPRLLESPVNLECRLTRILEFGTAPRKANLVIGEVVRVHVKDELYADGVILPHKLKAIGRLGAQLYCRTKDIFEMKRPYAGLS